MATRYRELVFFSSAAVAFVGCGRVGFDYSSDGQTLGAIETSQATDSSGGGAASSNDVVSEGAVDGVPAPSPEEPDSAFDDVERINLNLERTHTPWVDQMIQPLSDGRLLLGFHTQTQDTHFVSVAALLPSGDLDLSFGQDGIASHMWEADIQFKTLRVNEQENEIILGGKSADRASVMKLDLDGQRRQEFGSQGQALHTTIHGGAVNSLAVLDDGRIWLGGHTDRGSDGHDLQILGLSEIGDADPVLDVDGWLRFPGPGLADDFGGLLGTMPDGRLIAAGSCRGTFPGSRSDFCSVFLEADGSVIRELGQEGWSVHDSDNRNDTLRDLDTNGEIVLAGTSELSGRSDVMLVKLSPQGTPVTGFGDNGVQVIDLGGAESAECVVLLDDGRVLVGGDTTTNGTQDAFVMALDVNGAMAEQFGEDGIWILPSSMNERVWSMALDHAGALVVYGVTEGAQGEDSFVVRLEL